MTYRLHSFCQSGNSFKVALMLRCLQAPWEPVFVDYMNGVTRTDSWREQFNELGEVPILEDGETFLTQSGVILTYLADKHARFGGSTDSERREILRWLFFDNHKFSSYFVSYRFLKSFGATAPEPTVMAWLKVRIDAAFSIVDKHLQTNTYVVGAAPTIADFSMCGYLFFPEDESECQVQQRFPSIARWLERIRSLDGWAEPYSILPGQRIPPRW